MSFESELTQFSKLFRKRLNDNRQPQIRWVTATSVDENSLTMTATGLTDELEYLEIMLGSQKICTIPAVGSLCLIGLVEGQEAHTFLIHAEEVDKIVINVNTSIDIKGSGDQQLGLQLSKLITEICNIYVIEGTSPNIKNLTTIQTNIKKILKTDEET